MARPDNLEHLTHGKLLTQTNFPNFVDTYNYTVNRCDNLKGDRDADPQNGSIEVDNANPEYPIIRLRIGDDSASGTFSIVTKIEWDTENYKIVAKGMDFEFANGMLKSVKGDDTTEDKLKVISEIETTPWTGE